MGNITVYFKRLNFGVNQLHIGVNFYYHEFVVWTDDEGNQQIIRGGPNIENSVTNGGGIGSSGMGSPGDGSNIPFGSILVTYGNFKQSKDHSHSQNDPRQTVITGSDSELKPRFMAMIDEGDKINKQNIAYAFAGPNSNSVATTLLLAAGLPLPTGNALNGPTPAPGADISLLGNQYSPASEYRELSDNVANRLADYAAHWATMERLHRRIQAIARQQRASFAPVKRGGKQNKPNVLQQSPAASDKDIPRQGVRGPSLREMLDNAKQAQVHYSPPHRHPAFEKIRTIQAVGMRLATPTTRMTSRRTANQTDKHAPKGGLTLRNILAISRAGTRSLLGNGNVPANISRIYPNNEMQMSFAPVRRPERAPARPSMAQPAGEETSRRNGAPFGVPHPITQEEFREALSKHLDREALLPPSGPTGFDPRLSPAWPGLKSPN